MNVSIDAQCHEWANRAMGCSHSVVHFLNMDVSSVLEDLTWYESNLRFYCDGMIEFANRIIALRMQQAAETAQGGAL